MVAVLADSRQEGKTAWVATRGLFRVKVSGIAGCKVRILLKPDHLLGLEVLDDGEYDLPGEPEFVMAEHIETTKDSRVFVDLVR